MQEVTEGRTLIKEELEKRNKMLEMVEQTEGFHKLTPKQQRLIKASLYIQQRAERGTDRASKQAIISPKTHVTEETRILPKEHLIEMNKQESSFYSHPEKRKYQHSQNHIAEWYCHAAIYNLEQGNSLSVEPPKIPDKYFDGDYEQAPDYDRVIELSDQTGFPCIFIVSSSGENRHPFSGHSFLVLGHDQQGELVIWDKKSFELTYRITTVEQVYKELSGHGYYWAVRPLEEDKSDSS